LKEKAELGKRPPAALIPKMKHLFDTRFKLPMAKALIGFSKVPCFSDLHPCPLGAVPDGFEQAAEPSPG
jgi:hypothetical protein